MNLHVAATNHCYLAICCDCGHETIARPASGLCSHVEGRRRNLQMSERCLVGLMLAAIMRLMAGIKWSCQCNRHEVDTKLPRLAGEILNDWDAVITFVGDPDVPPTNNDDAERAHRNAVIFRRISFDTRSVEGSRLYAAALSVIDTCRKHRTDPWAYGSAQITAGRANTLLSTVPAQVRT